MSELNESVLLSITLQNDLSNVDIVSKAETKEKVDVLVGALAEFFAKYPTVYNDVSEKLRLRQEDV